MTEAKIVEAAPLKVLWPEMYSGNGGVVSNETQLVSIKVSGLLSRSPCWIAVIGRQVLYLYLASQAAMPASAIARFKSANTRAFCTKEKPKFVEIFSATAFQWPGGVTVLLKSDQNRAISICSA